VPSFARLDDIAPLKILRKAAMKRWGLVIAILYALIAVAFLIPAMLLLCEPSRPTLQQFQEIYASVVTWILLGILLVGEVVLLSLTVDTSHRRLRPRRAVTLTAVVAGFFLAFLMLEGALAFFLAVWGENKVPEPGWTAMISGAVFLWILWTVLFYGLYRDSTDPVTNAVKWLFRGSVLELLVAVPAHVIVRRRHDCCAPGVTGFGITMGIAIMLLSFGPSVLLLFKKRMELSKPKELTIQ
jgi:hypothetical protein